MTLSLFRAAEWNKKLEPVGSQSLLQFAASTGKSNQGESEIYVRKYVTYMSIFGILQACKMANQAANCNKSLSPTEYCGM